MANEEQERILRFVLEEADRDLWNNWRLLNPEVPIDLSEINLIGDDLRFLDFKNANLSKAVLRLANLSNSEFKNADLTNADFRGADLSSSDFSGAKLIRTLLGEANLTEANLTGTDLTRSRLGYTVLARLDLSETVGLEEIIHTSPSSLTFDTIHLSKGKLPAEFLLGTGLNKIEIELSKLLLPGLDPTQLSDITGLVQSLYRGSESNYFSCFISYSSKDENFARRLHNDLQNNGVRCWFAPEDMKIGDQIRPRIDQEIRLKDKLLVILSEKSISSEWVGDEVEAALVEESKSNRPILFPIRLDDAVMDIRDGWAAKIKRSRHIGDFSIWKEKGSYQKAFDRLLRDLKASGGNTDGK
jgi:uncharacterized protein YjbI with pentapeptide repeats